MTISQGQLAGTATNICVCGASEERAVLNIVFCNTDSSARTITLYVVPSGGSESDSTKIANEVSIDAGDSYVWTDKILLGNSDKISGLASVASKITFTASYKSF